MLKPGRVWQEETFKIEIKVVFSFLAFLCFFLAERKPCLTNFSDKLKARKANKEQLLCQILRNFTEGNSRNLIRSFLFFSPQWQLRHQNRNSPRSLCEHARIFEPRGLVDKRLDNGGLIKIHTRPFRLNSFLYVFF